MEKKKHKELVFVTQADNGIVYDETWCDSGERQVILILDEDKSEKVGDEILESINCVMNDNCANKVKIEITYTPLED